MASKRTAAASDASSGHPAKRLATASGSRPPSRIGSLAGAAPHAVVNNRGQASGIRRPLSAASPNEVPTTNYSKSSDLKAAIKANGLVRQNTSRPATVFSSHVKTLSSGSNTARANTQDANQDATHLASSDASSSNIRVVVRCRGPSRKELAESTELCVSTNPTRGQEVAIAQSALVSQTQSSVPAQSTSAAASLLLPGLASQSELPAGKLYNFDHVFGEQADQAMLYAEVVQPIIEEVLLGYNCTVFAYGQTGTGKTYTMEGDLTPSPLGTFSPEAGIIPRTLHRLFHILEGSEFTLKVSFLELYNEELRDLNVSDASSSQDDTVASGSNGPLKIFDDTGRKGGVVIQGLEETYIKDAAAGIKILTRGSQRRQQASTNCNDHSSRSHSIFTITATIKEVSSKGEDLIKVGKLNLVDLAGSENVGRSGAITIRAREAGMINQSLLTLGRVINALVERSSHVPYRESKLTRLLQDSLGGRTKTCVIATISPSRLNLEETMSTLDYAARAKTIRNKPEVNSRMTKAALLQTYAQEMERMKADLLAAREMNGIFLSEESWMEISAEHDARKAELNEARKEKDIWQSRYRTTQEQFDQAIRVLNQRDAEMRSLNDSLVEERSNLSATEQQLAETRRILSEEECLRRAYEDERRTWKTFAEGATSDIEGLLEKLGRTSSIEMANEQTVRTAHAQLDNAVSRLLQGILACKTSHSAFRTSHSDILKAASERHTQSLQANHAFLEEQLSTLAASGTKLRQRLTSQDIQLQSFLQLIDTELQALVTNFRQKQQYTLAADSQLWKTVEEQCTSILQASEESNATLLVRVEAITSAVEGVVTIQENYIREKRDREQKAWHSETAHLRSQNEALTRMLTSRRESAKKWQTELLSAVNDSMTQFNDAQDGLLKTHVDAFQLSSEEMHADRNENHKGQVGTLDQLQRGAASHRLSLDECIDQLQDAAKANTTTTISSIESMLTNMQSQKTAAAQTRQTSLTDLESRSANLQSHCEKFDEARNEQRAEALQEFDGIIGEAEETYKDLQIDMTERADELHGDFADLESTTAEFNQSSDRHYTASNDLLLQVRAQLRQHLVDDMRANKPTGCTPQKRCRPAALANVEGTDLFDAADRHTLLEVLRRRKTERERSEDDESREMPIENKSSSAQRLSSTLAARKAARRSSVLRV